MTELTAIVAPLAALMGVALTLYGQAWAAHRNRSFELGKERMRLSHESAEKRLWLIRERLEKLHLLVGEIGREFSLTFLTIDWEANLKRAEYHEKYRMLCAKLEEAQMIADLYVESVSEHLVALGGEMNCYWGNFAQMLHLGERGEKVDHKSKCYEEACKHSRSIPGKVTDVQRELRARSAIIMNQDEEA